MVNKHFPIRKQHVKDGKNFKIIVSKMYITVAIGPRFVTDHVKLMGD